ncbi:hypothetical protein BGZ52_010390 [Haplosporangium bisporale]|nr:hypothetical protein BGZ52_010390 [Haplosporangium bisporale]
MDPATPNQASRDQERTALSRTLNSLALAVQSSVFGGLGSLAHDLTLTEKRTLDSTLFASRRCSTTKVPLPIQAQQQQQQQQQQQSQPVNSATFFDQQTEHQQRPWYKKKYRIIVQEISDDDDNSSISDTTTAGTGLPITAESDIAIAPTLPKSGSSSSSTTAMPPGLLDWLLFTTHEDSFFRHLGRANALASQINYRSPDVPTTANDTSALLSYVGAPSPVTPETPFHAVPEPEASSSRSNIAMALATEINNSHPSIRPETHVVSVQESPEPSPVLVHRAETMDGTTVVRSHGFEGQVQMIAATTVVPRKGFEDVDLQTPWWKKRQEQEGAPSWISEKNKGSHVQESKGKMELHPAEETLDPSLGRRSLHSAVEQPKTLETFVRTTVCTRPDGAIESKTVKVSTLLKDTQELAGQDQHQHQHQDRRHGRWFRRHHHQDHRASMSTMVETETRVKVVHLDGSVEETVSFTRDSPSSPSPVGPPARTRREHRHHLRQQERERREQEWQAQQEVRQELHLQRQQQEEHRQQQQQQQQQHEQRQWQSPFEPRAENAPQESTRFRFRERWARQENQVQDLDQDELSSSRTRSRSWPPKGYFRRQSSQPQPSGDQEHDDDTSTSTWPPKGYLRRQEREQ